MYFNDVDIKAAERIPGFSLIESVIALVLMSLTSLAFFHISGVLSTDTNYFSLEMENLKNEIVVKYKRGEATENELFRNKELTIEAVVKQHEQFPQFDRLTLTTSLANQGMLDVDHYLLIKDD